MGVSEDPNKYAIVSATMRARAKRSTYIELGLKQVMRSMSIRIL